GFSSVLLVSSMAASLTADALSRKVFGMEPILDFHLETPFPFAHYGFLALFALCLGVLGVLFNRVLLGTQDLFSGLRWLSLPFRPVPVFLLAGILGFFVPQVLGGGHHLIASLQATPYTLWVLLLLVSLKFLFTMVSYASATPGGIFFPLLTIGALLGAIWGKAFTGILSLDFVVLGMAGYFSAITKAPITGTLLILEVTGSFYHLPAIAFSCLLAYVVADLLGGKPVYDVLLRRLEKKCSRSLDSKSEPEHTG
ncbi:MAG: chloride channel protein, partial [Candidatus Caldatribacteriaceae bacterium]